MPLGSTALFLVKGNVPLGSTALFLVEGNVPLGSASLFLVEGNMPLGSTASLWSGICYRAAQLLLLFLFCCFLWSFCFVFVFCGGEYVTRPLCCFLSCGCIMIATKFCTAAFRLLHKVGTQSTLK